MQKDDPFGLFDDSDRTVVLRPQPGGRHPLPPTMGAPPPPLPEAGSTAAAGSVGRNPLVRAATPVLALAPHLKTPSPPGDPETLRLRLGEQIQRVERDALAAGADRDTARLAAWALAALIDDVVLNTPWGGHSAWAAKSLVGTLFHEVAAGERFFERLSELEREPGRHRDLLELMYLCLALGFEGRYRLQGRAGSGVEGVREGLYRLIAPRDTSSDLSPAWKGVEAAHRPLAAALPLWVVGAATLALLALLYTGFAFRLAGTTEQIGPLLQALPPQGPVQLVRELRPPPEVARPAPPPPRLVTALKPRIEEFLAPEVQAGIVTVEEDAQRVLVRVRDQGLFGSGRAELATAFIDPLERLGRALNDEPGRILVIGHSDNVPIRTPRFPSNWELSRARAEAVAGMLSLFLGNPGRIAADGRAETEPIASNATPEGRSANRRVEILLLKDG